MLNSSSLNIVLDSHACSVAGEHPVGLDAILGKKLFWGHMSVGDDIIQGIAELPFKAPCRPLNVVDLSSREDIGLPGLYHRGIGRNGHPFEKIEAFRRLIVETGLGRRIDIAFFKFCYVDIDRDTEVHAVFDQYRTTMIEVANEFPDLDVVHMTVPLTTHRRGLKDSIRNILTGDLANVNRGLYNEMLRTEYGGEGKVFDLARSESTFRSGRRLTFKYRGREYESLIPDLTSDGGHLNLNGRRKLAKALLKFLERRSSLVKH